MVKPLPQVEQPLKYAIRCKKQSASRFEGKNRTIQEQNNPETLSEDNYRLEWVILVQCPCILQEEGSLNARIHNESRWRLYLAEKGQKDNLNFDGVLPLQYSVSPL